MADRKPLSELLLDDAPPALLAGELRPDRLTDGEPGRLPDGEADGEAAVLGAEGERGHSGDVSTASKPGLWLGPASARASGASGRTSV